MAAKRKFLSLDEKSKAINRLEKGSPAYKVAEEFGVGKTQIQNLRKRKCEVFEQVERNVPLDTKRRRRATGNEEINQLTYEWSDLHYLNKTQELIRFGYITIMPQLTDFQRKVITLFKSEDPTCPFPQCDELHNIATGITADSACNQHMAEDVGNAILKTLEGQDAFLVLV
ncbi:hypothetical protein GQR58_008296 [Nymphon striatum]|nr:hypothetical protein GQR58_008296 [Nymphon striatum]